MSITAIDTSRKVYNLSQVVLRRLVLRGLSVSCIWFLSLNPYLYCNHFAVAWENKTMSFTVRNLGSKVSSLSEVIWDSFIYMFHLSHIWFFSLQALFVPWYLFHQAIFFSIKTLKCKDSKNLQNFGKSMLLKNYTHVKKVGHTSEFLFDIYWWTQKTNNYQKKLLKWANKNKLVLILTMLNFFLKKKKKHL